MNAFRKLQSILCTRPCLTPVDFEKEFILTVDGASSIGFGAILSQIGNDGEEHPCCYASKSLSPRETNQAATVTEANALLWACRTFKPYLVGRHFVIRTDHRPLTTLNRMQGQTLERIQCELDSFRPFTLQYLPGKNMPADCLSRRPVESAPISADNISPSFLLTWEQLYHVQRLDPEAKALACFLKFNSFPISVSLRRFVRLWGPRASLRRGVVVIRVANSRRDYDQAKFRPFVPRTMRPQLLHLSHDNPMAGHYSTVKTWHRVAETWFWPNMMQDIKSYCSNCHTCAIVNKPTHLKPVPLEQMAKPLKFGSIIHLDILGPLPLTPTGKRYALVITDSYSRWTEIFALPNKTTEEVATTLLNGWFLKHSIPSRVTSDLGSENTSKLMTELKMKMQYVFILHFHL